MQKIYQMETAYLSTGYLSPVQYFCKLYHFPHVVIEADCNYVKQSYRNRCNIATPNGPTALTIPIERGSEGKSKTKEIRISEHGNWQHLHWQAIISAYNNTPFFEFYRDDFEPFYSKKYHFLFDFNEQLRSLIVGLIDIECQVSYSEKYQKELMPSQFDFRDSIHPKKEISNDLEFAPIPYHQVFDRQNGFTPNLSIIDLLFNCGPESLLILRDSHQSHRSW